MIWHVHPKWLMVLSSCLLSMNQSKIDTFQSHAQCSQEKLWIQPWAGSNAYWKWKNECLEHVLETITGHRTLQRFYTLWEGVITEFLRNCSLLKYLVMIQICVVTTTSLLTVHLAYTAKNLNTDLNDMLLQSHLVKHQNLPISSSRHQKNMIIPGYRNSSNSHCDSSHF